MKLTFLKYAAIVTLGFSCVLGGGAWYATSQAPKWAKSYAHEFGQSIGYLIDFNDLKITLREPSIAISDLKIVELANQNQLLDVKRLQVNAKWGPLFQRKIELSQVSIDQAHVLADKYPDNWNWLRFIQAVQKKFPKKADTKPSKPMEFLVDEFNLTDGSLKIHDPEQNFTTEFTPLNIELKKTTNIDSKGELGGLETKYVVSLGDVSLPVPKTDRKLHLGKVVLGGDFDLDENKDIFLRMKAKIEEGLIDTNTHIFKTQNKIESDINLEQLSLVPFIDFATPKVDRSEKSGTATGQFKFMHHEKNTVLDGEVKVEDMSVVPFISLAPTLNTIYAKSGGTSGEFKIHYDPENTIVGGNIVLNQLAIFEPDKTSELLGWDSAKVNHFDYEKKPTGQKVRVEEIKVDDLKARYVVFGDRSNNFRRMFKPSTEEIEKIELEKKNALLEKKVSQQSAPEAFVKEVLVKQVLPAMVHLVANASSPTKPAKNQDLDDAVDTRTSAVKKPFNLNMKSIEITRGKIDFSDFSVKPNFKTDIHNFHGTLIGISTYPQRYATGAFDGLIAPSGDMKLKAQIAFADTRRNHDINMSFRRIPLSSINPYATTFAGYEVKSGTLSYDSRFLTKDGNLQGDNRFIINQMQLGDQVPDYKGKNIPLGLIIALLEDENGVIDLNLKVEGNVDKPNFKIGELVWDAVWTILGNVVTAPFKMIGRLIGIEGYTGVYFDPGQSTLRPSESLKLENIEAGMKKRPKTKLKINGVFDPEADRLFLNTDKVDRVLFKNAGFKLAEGEPLPQLPLEDERVQRAIRKMYLDSGAKIKPELKLVAGPAGVEDWKILHNELVAAGKVSDEDLHLLANRRAKIVQAELVKINPDLASRLSLIDDKVEVAVKDGIPVGIEIIAD